MKSLVNYSTGHFHVFTKILKPFTIGSKRYVLYEKMKEKMYVYGELYKRIYVYEEIYMHISKNKDVSTDNGCQKVKGLIT